MLIRRGCRAWFKADVEPVLGHVIDPIFPQPGKRDVGAKRDPGKAIRKGQSVFPRMRWRRRGTDVG
ncbi:hypothetical protein HMP06_0429 [Sphingomonas sp. HMP6]|nr:hypothetical protein HMP06_0429 [Sphingomonas sp. HMP6]